MRIRDVIALSVISIAFLTGNPVAASDPQECADPEIIKSLNDKFMILETEKESLRQKLSSCIVSDNEGANKIPPELKERTQKDGRRIRHLEQKVKKLKEENEDLNTKLIAIQKEFDVDAALLSEIVASDVEPVENIEILEEGENLESTENPEIGESLESDQSQDGDEQEELVIDKFPLSNESDDELTPEIIGEVEAVEKIEEVPSLLPTISEKTAEPANVQDIVKPACTDMNETLTFESDLKKVLKTITTENKGTVSALLKEIWRTSEHHNEHQDPEQKACNYTIHNDIFTDIMLRRPQVRESKGNYDQEMIQYLHNELQSIK